jgi:hypothetical protein
MTRAAALIALLSLFALTGCGHRDAFPMHNDETGQDVVCHSGEYWIEEGMPQMRVTLACLHACEMKGYRRHTGNPYADEPHPAPPPDDLKPEIPQACWP